MTKSKTIKWYQIRCTSSKHRIHKFQPKKDEKKAQASLSGLEEHAAKHSELYYADCTPYKMFTRTISEWEEVE